MRLTRSLIAILSIFGWHLIQTFLDVDNCKKKLYYLLAHVVGAYKGWP